MTRIVLDRLTKTFPTQPTPVLRGLSLDVHPGELVALLGPSGSGKSTILKIIAGIEQPDRGDVRFDEGSLLPVPPHQRGAVLMFQKAYLFPFLNVADNIGFGLKLQGMRKHQRRAEIARMLDLVELPGIERKYPAQLSGGQQQRVALARALVVQPRVLLLDEPFSSLDTAIRHTLQETIRRVQRELGITALLVTHDLHEAIAMSDRTALLFDGMIEAYDQPQRLFQNPPTKAAAAFMGISTFLTGCLSGEQLYGPWGSLRVPPASGPRREATFAIRPEHMVVLDTASNNSLAGTVRSVLYKGEYTAYEVAVGQVHMHIRAYQEGRRYPEGAAVHVHVPVEKLFEVH